MAALPTETNTHLRLTTLNVHEHPLYVMYHVTTVRKIHAQGRYHGRHSSLSTMGELRIGSSTQGDDAVSLQQRSVLCVTLSLFCLWSPF